MQMITKNHLDYINNELINMDENTYSHKWIYEWHDEYLSQRFFTELEYADLERIETLKTKGRNSVLEVGEDLNDVKEILRFNWENRYNTLSQKTIFFRNLMVFSNLFWHSNSPEEYKMKLDLNGLQEEYSNFWIVWLYNKPGYEFSFDWKTDKPEKAIGYDDEYKKWKTLEKMYLEIEYNSRPMTTFDEFIKEELVK